MLGYIIKCYVDVVQYIFKIKSIERKQKMEHWAEVIISYQYHIRSLIKIIITFIKNVSCHLETGNREAVSFMFADKVQNGLLLVQGP